MNSFLPDCKQDRLTFMLQRELHVNTAKRVSIFYNKTSACLLYILTKTRYAQIFSNFTSVT